MTQARFKIVFSGELMPEVELETAKDNLATLFKSDRTRINSLFSGSPVAIKRDLLESEADKYIAVLEQAGAKARKEPDLAASMTLVDTDDHNPAPETATAQMKCPKCGQQQAKAIECTACGIVIEKFLARQAQLEEAAKNAPPAVAPIAAPTAAAHTPYAPPQAPVGETLAEFGELKPFTTNGRIGRLRYLAWSFVLMLISAPVLGLLAFIGISNSSMIGMILIAVASIALIVVLIMIAVQRLHDCGWSGWLLLISLVPIVGSIFNIVMLVMPGNKSANRYGQIPPPNSTAVKVLAGLWLAVIALGFIAGISMPALLPDLPTN